MIYMDFKRFTYKSLTLYEAFEENMRKLKKRHSNPIVFLKLHWQDYAPDWAKNLEPALIKEEVLFFKTTDSNAFMLQFRESELVDLASSIIGPCISKIKILAKN